MRRGGGGTDKSIVKRRRPASVVRASATGVADIDPQGAQYQILIDTLPGAAELAGTQAAIALRPDKPDLLQALVPPDPRTLRNQVQGDVTSLFYALAELALVIGTAAIANATLLNIIERRPEIGLRRALGATKGHVTRHITLDAALAAITGTAVAVVALALATIAGLLPAIKAVNTPPATTLRG